MNRLLVILAVAATPLACSAVLGIHDITAPSEGGAAETGAPDAGTEAAADGADAVGIYNDIADPNNWLALDLSNIVPGSSFAGAVFDGRWLYFVPYQSNGRQGGTVASYDTTQPITAMASWQTFDVTTAYPGARGFIGGTFDGRYVYLVPNQNGDDGGLDGLALRYDTKGQGFQVPTSWGAFDMTALSPSAVGYYGGVYDQAHHVYYVPSNDPGPSGLVVQTDTSGSFADSGSWATFDTTTLAGSPSQFAGGTFDGKYVYFVPFGNGTVARYDTTAPFGVATSWSTFDATTLDPRAQGFVGAVHAGHYVYFVPNFGTAADGFAVRYDTTRPFASPAAWATFDATTVNTGSGGFLGGAFDGRYVYFAPFLGGGSVVTRFDTEAAFDAGTAWTTFDTSKLIPSASVFLGAAFDGTNVYFVPTRGVLARFTARTVPAPPATVPPSFL